jgi:nucleoside-diphosphate-sugar epimerase
LSRESDHEVVIFDRVAPTTAGARWVAGDIQDLGDVISAARGADAIVHLAGIPQPGFGPDATLFRVNALGAFNVHEAAFILGIRRVVSSSSAAVMGYAYRTREVIPEYLPIDEAHPPGGQDVYSMSKLCLEQIARTYSLRCDMETIVLRPPQVYLPDGMERLHRQGGATPTRFDPFAYVDVRDLGRAYRCAVETPGLGHECVFVTADDSAVAEPLAELLPRLLPEIREKAKALTGTQPGISNARAKRVLRWEPRHTWRQLEAI